MIYIYIIKAKEHDFVSIIAHDQDIVKKCKPYPLPFQLLKNKCKNLNDLVIYA